MYVDKTFVYTLPRGKLGYIVNRGHIEGIFTLPRK